MKTFLFGLGAATLLLMPLPRAIAQSAPADPDAINYGALNNRVYDYADLKQAKGRDLSDTRIAKIAKIAEESGMPFSDVLNAVVIRGMTFASLAGEYGIPVSDLDDVEKEKDEIANYFSAYETSGQYGVNAMAPAVRTSGSRMSHVMSITAPMSAAAPAGDVVDVAMATPQLSTLVKAVQAAGLVDTLKGAGPFTVFAPTDRAFARLPKGDLDRLLADPAALKSVLTYHVISGQRIDAAAAMGMTSPTSPPTAQGGTLSVTTRRGKVMVNDATVVKADVPATNGVIHLIDRVLMPPAAAPTP